MKAWVLSKYCILTLLLIILPSVGFSADLSLDAFKITPGDQGTQTYSVNIQLLLLMTSLTLLPAILLMTTSFTRIIIVLSILRQALGMPQTPSNQIIIGLSVFLSVFIMSPVLSDIYQESVKPYSEQKITQSDAIDKATLYIKKFMYNQTREDDLALFMEMSQSKVDNIENAQDVPFPILISAFITSELKTAFQIGFVIFIPFLIVDLVVASVLMSMGMMMLSPVIISLPFKIMLFVLVDGWNLILGTLASSFHM